jgi:glycosyltransferase involved in cell wall biosynthesis
MTESIKRMSLIVKAWKKINSNDWELVMLGDGPDLARTQELAQGVPRISFPGFQNPLPYLQESALCLMTSRYEGLPMTLIEAQSQACVPVVMDSFSSLHDIVVDGVNGRIVENGSVEAFAQAAQELMENKTLRQGMAERGLETCKKFEVSQIADEWETLFSGLL